MVDLTVHAVQWCAEHGHPFLALRVDGGERFFVVAVGAEEAAALAPRRTPGDSSADRLYDLVQVTVAGLGAHPLDVRLHVGEDGLLRASLRLTGPGGESVVPAHFTDGVVLARRLGCPLRIADADLARVPVDHGAAPGVPLPRPFRDLIAGLDLGGIGVEPS